MVHLRRRTVSREREDGFGSHLRSLWWKRRGRLRSPKRCVYRHIPPVLKLPPISQFGSEIPALMELLREPPSPPLRLCWSPSSCKFPKHTYINLLPLSLPPSLAFVVSSTDRSKQATETWRAGNLKTTRPQTCWLLFLTRLQSARLPQRGPKNKPEKKKRLL